MFTSYSLELEYNYKTLLKQQFMLNKIVLSFVLNYLIMKVLNLFISLRYTVKISFLTFINHLSSYD